MARITAKARVGSNVQVDAGQHEVRFYGDYANGANDAWAAATPVLEYRMVVKNSEVAALFPVGESFTVTFDNGE